VGELFRILCYQADVIAVEWDNGIHRSRTSIRAYYVFFASCQTSPVKFRGNKGCSQVGPVLDGSQPDGAYEGQFISAGYNGHGMTRAFAWYTTPSPVRETFSRG
jgi:hypothetical protein